MARPGPGSSTINVRLGHRTGRGEFLQNPEPGVVWRSTTEYLLIPLALARPEEGVIPIRITCPACDAELTFQLAGSREVSRKRLIHFALAITLALYVAISYLTGFNNVVQTWERGGALGTILQTILAASFIAAAVLSYVFFSRALRSEFRRAVIVPNMGYWLSQNHPDSIRKSFHEKRTGPTELQGHSIFPPKGKLEDTTSL